MSQMTETPSSPAAQFANALENSARLDGFVNAVQPLAAAVVGNESLRRVLQGDWLGHAVHPLLVQLPIGTWMSAGLLDFGPTSSRGAARLLTGAGVLTAVPAALTGWAEFSHAGPRARRVGVVHAATNVAAVVLQTASWAARRSGHHGIGRALGLGGLSVVSFGGFLGGHLSSARKLDSHDAAFGPEES